MGKYADKTMDLQYEHGCSSQFAAGFVTARGRASKIAAEADREIAELREALAAILYHDERGQGVGYKEAMDRAVELINRSAS